MKKYLVLITTLLLTISTLFLMPGVKANTGTNISINDLKNLPAVTGRFEEGANRNKTGKVEFTKQGSLYEVRVKHPDGNVYVLTTTEGDRPLGIELPYTLESKGNLILDSGIYFVNEAGEKNLYYEFQNPSSTKQVEESIFLDEDLPTNGYRPYVMWNIDTGRFYVTDKVTMIGVHYAGTDRRAYVDLYSNIDIDEILMIEFKWEYRYKKLIGGWTQWKTDQKTRYKDEIVNATSAWNEYKRLFKFFYGGGFLNMEWFKLAERMNQQTITKLNNGKAQNEVLLEKINNYLNKKDNPTKSYEEMFNIDHSVYRIYLDTYSKSFHTDYEIYDDIQLVDIMYEYQGEYFHPIVGDIDWTGIGGKGSEAEDHESPLLKAAKGFIDWLNETFQEYSWIIKIVIVMIVVGFLVYLLNSLIRFIRGVTGRY